MRFLWGKISQQLFTNKPRFSFREYIDGPKNGDFIFDSIGQRFNNIIIAIVTIIILTMVLSIFIT